MKISDDKLRRVISDLGINAPYYKGKDIPVSNCWHFSTDGNAVDAIFYDEEDFRSGMNRIYVILPLYNIIILAFSLMDTHVHFILYGSFDDCNRFMHEYIRRTSIYISRKYGERKKMDGVEISHQQIDTDWYLKIAICYVIKNAPVGGLPWMGYDYPWSSGALYFRKQGYWTSPCWTANSSGNNPDRLGELSKIGRKKVMKTRNAELADARMIDGIVFPGEYVAYELVEMVFKSTKSFNYFMCISKDSDVESRGGMISYLSLPIQELRQHKNEICQQLFGLKDSHMLDTGKRLILARTLKGRFNSSSRQIARICGLKYDEVKDLL